MLIFDYMKCTVGMYVLHYAVYLAVYDLNVLRVFPSTWWPASMMVWTWLGYANALVNYDHWIHD